MSDIWQDRAGIFKTGYDEVLLALKHQDDKVNRTLTAIAFLTAAGVALYTQVGGDVHLKFDGAPLEVTSLFFMIFIIAVVLALGFILAAIGPSRSLPTWKPLPPPPSLIYYASISQSNDWPNYISWQPARLQQMLAENLHRETPLLARRVNYKIARSREAVAFVHMVIISLSLLGIFSVEVLPARTRWWIAASFLLLLVLLPLWDLVQMKLAEFPELPISWVNYSLLALAGLWAAILLFRAPAWNARWPAIGYALGAILFSRLSFIGHQFARFLLPAINVGGLVALILVCS